MDLWAFETISPSISCPIKCHSLDIRMCLNLRRILISQDMAKAIMDVGRPRQTLEMAEMAAMLEGEITTSLTCCTAGIIRSIPARRVRLRTITIREGDLILTTITITITITITTMLARRIASKIPISRPAQMAFVVSKKTGLAGMGEDVVWNRRAHGNNTAIGECRSR